jgi:hypothetical protein
MSSAACIGSFVISNKTALITLAIEGFNRLCEFFHHKNVKGIVLVPDSIKFITENLLNSRNSHLVNLDLVFGNQLDEDEKKEIHDLDDDLSQMIRVFPKVKPLVEELKEIVRSNNVILLHSNMFLLKYLKCRDMLYFLPSDAMLQQLKAANPDFDEVTFQKYKAEIRTFKPDKIHVYNTHSELEAMIQESYSDLIIKT